MRLLAVRELGHAGVQASLITGGAGRLARDQEEARLIHVARGGLGDALLGRARGARCGRAATLRHAAVVDAPKVVKKRLGPALVRVEACRFARGVAGGWCKALLQRHGVGRGKVGIAGLTAERLCAGEAGVAIHGGRRTGLGQRIGQRAGVLCCITRAGIEQRRIGSGRVCRAAAGRALATAHGQAGQAEQAEA